MTMRAGIWLLLAWCATASPVATQDAPVEPPKLGQPSDFSQIVGSFRIEAAVNPNVAAVEEPLLLTVTISGRAVAPWLPLREHLRIFPDGCQRDFYIEPVGEDRKEAAWQFIYRLKPKHAHVQFIPSLKLVYFAPRQRRYQSAYSDALPIKVTPKVESSMVIPGLKVVQAPDGFFELSDQDNADYSLAMSLLHLQPATLAALLLLPPLLSAGVVLAVRRRRQAATARERRLGHLVSSTLASLERKPGETATALRCVTEYLRQRFDVALQEPTPAEVERLLQRRGVARPIREQWRRLFQDFDAGRFAPAANHRAAPVEPSAIELIRTLEAQRCMSGQ